MMVLLSLLAVGLLSLSSMSLRSSSTSADINMARSNARMALMLAIGELQKNAGPDTRVTARADILDENNPPVTGVWKSWEGTDHETSGNNLGRPISPGDYESAKEERFLTWLVSGIEPGEAELPNTASSQDHVALLGENSVGEGADRAQLQIHLEPTEIDTEGKPGGFAWWVSGENQKARLPKPYEPTEDSSGRWAVNMKSHAVADTEPFGMDQLLQDPSPAQKGISLKQIDLFSESGQRPTSQEYFHDLSPYSVGLLTNTATGGWKKDLSLLTENWEDLRKNNLPFFRVEPGVDIEYNIPTGSNALPDKSMLYPWAQYREKDGPPIYKHGPVASWENLKDYARAYRDMGMQISGNGRAVMQPRMEDIEGNDFRFLHQVRVLPVIARVQWVFSHYAIPPTEPGAPEGNLQPVLLVTPVVTIWNPYNVEINFTRIPLSFALLRPIPVAFNYSVGTEQNRRWNSLTKSLNYNPPLEGGGLSYQITQRFSLKPGEARVFSPRETRSPASGGTGPLELTPGYQTGGGSIYYLKKDNGLVHYYAPPETTMKANARFDSSYNDIGAIGVGVYLDMTCGSVWSLAYRMLFTTQVAKEVYPTVTNLATSPPLSSLVDNPAPFLTTMFGARMASKTHLAAKGFVQSSPFVNYTSMGVKDIAERGIGRHYAGTYHPVNSPFDFSFEPVSKNDSLLPNASDSTNRGYIVTGFTAADGLSRCVVAELPTRPLQSLAELQHWDMRYENPIPPYSFNIIGNSDATPLLPSDDVVNSKDRNWVRNLQHDDSYCANHLLFDDWFFSSIAPDPDDFGTRGRDLRSVYREFVSGDEPLGNRAYQPIAEDRAFAAGSNGNSNELYQEEVDTRDSWQTIASRIEVEGMFNVNSTSVTAWRALLGHARDQKVPYIDESASSWAASLSSETDYAFSRTSVAGDVEASQSGTSGAFPDATQFAGYRVLTDDMLDALAEQVVEQVRLRGPFLSLSEFVNRQLSSGDLALAGTIQAALDEIAKKNATNPYSVMQSVNPRMASATPTSAGDAEYSFPEAAVGSSTYGLPGWTRQADVLRPIAPILNARDDTFTIRAYGDARNEGGQITASAVCEAVVRRTRDYVDMSDEADITTLPTKEVNRTFGRRFEIVSFRWLSPSEI